MIGKHMHWLWHVGIIALLIVFIAAPIGWIWNALLGNDLVVVITIIVFIGIVIDAAFLISKLIRWSIGGFKRN